MYTVFDGQKFLKVAEDNYRKFQEEVAEKDRNKHFYQLSCFDKRRYTQLQTECRQFPEQINEVHLNFLR